MEILSSRTNDKIKDAVKLRDSSQHRRQKNLFFAEGARLCADAAESGAEAEELFITSEAASKYSAYTDRLFQSAKHCYEISDEVANKLSDTKNPQGVFSVFKMLDKSANIGKINYNGKYAVLEEISNPSNFGAVCRTAEAVGLDGIIVSGGCDIYNPKALRASMGSLFRLGVTETENLAEYIINLKANGMKIYSSVPSSTALSVLEADMSGGVAVVIGNEGNGISESTVKASSGLITIPMRGRAESLNAAAAASIIMWEMMR